MSYLTVINQITWNNASCVSFAENEISLKIEDAFKIELKTSQARRTYLVTYSRADLSKFPARQSFGEQVVAYFNAVRGKSKLNTGHVVRNRTIPRPGYVCMYAPEEEQKDISPCPRCFTELVLLDEDF